MHLVWLKESGSHPLHQVSPQHDGPDRSGVIVAVSQIYVATLLVPRQGHTFLDATLADSGGLLLVWHVAPFATTLADNSFFA